VILLDWRIALRGLGLPLVQEELDVGPDLLPLAPVQLQEESEQIGQITAIGSRQRL
jgi:hypothetical protein